MSGPRSKSKEIDIRELIPTVNPKRKINLSDAERERRRKQLERVKATPEQLSAGGKKGAAISHQRQREKKEAANRFIEEALRQKADEMIDRIIKPYFEALDLEPDPSWSPMTKLNFFLEQTTAAEKVASRLEGLPVARRREVDAEGNDRARIAELPMKAVERALAGALSTGQVNIDEIELGPDDVEEVSG